MRSGFFDRQGMRGYESRPKRSMGRLIWTWWRLGGCNEKWVVQSIEVIRLFQTKEGNGESGGFVMARRREFEING